MTTRRLSGEADAERQRRDAEINLVPCPCQALSPRARADHSVSALSHAQTALQCHPDSPRATVCVCAINRVSFALASELRITPNAHPPGGRRVNRTRLAIDGDALLLPDVLIH